MKFQPFFGSGCGNTFLVMPQDFCDRNTDELIRLIWRKTNVDSILVLRPTAKGDIMMLVPGEDGIWGKESGEFCGNGSRVVAKFFHEQFGRSPIIISRSGSAFPSWVDGNTVRVKFPLPEIRGNVVLAGGEPHSLVSSQMSIPELLHFCNDRTHRVSANQVDVLSPSHIKVRTFEHSINKFTGCCGTGCTSMTYLTYRQGKIGDQVLVEAPGGMLTMGIGKNVIMSGPAELKGVLCN